MPRSPQLIDILQNVVGADLNSGSQSVVHFFTHNDVAGGWEGWLQVAYAMGVFAYNDTSNYNREVAYPNNWRCDLWFQATRGVPIWIELKSQRSSSYTGTVGDFATDIQKILELGQAFLSKNVNVAMAVLSPRSSDLTMLNEIRNAGPRGVLKYMIFANSGWVDVTAKILEAPTGGTLLATWRYS
jgi:hypothetical protein